MVPAAADGTVDEVLAMTSPRVRFANVLIMGFGFMWLFTAYNTVQGLETEILKELQFNLLGFWSLSVLYISVAATVFLAPLIVFYLDERKSMWLGALCYWCASMQVTIDSSVSVYIASLVKIIPAIVYVASVIIGFGAAIMWIAQGAFIIRCSEEETLGRNTGIFWGVFQLSGIIGNLAAFLLLRAGYSAHILFIALLGSGLLGVAILFALRPVRSAATVKPEAPTTPVALLKDGFHLLGNADMLLMLVICFYSGLELSFYAGEFPLLVGFAEGSKRVAEVNIVFGAAEVFGGLVVGRLSDLLPRKVIMAFAMLVYSGGLVIAWLIRLYPRQTWAQFVCAACLGLGDASFNTQIYASLGTLFPSPRKIVVAFTTFQFFQNIGSAAGFFFFAYVPVHGPRGTLIPLEILAGVGWLGTLLYLLVRLQPVPEELDEASMGLINH